MSKCILTDQEWLDFYKTINIIDMLINSPETNILGRELLFDIRFQRVVWAYGMLAECDKINVDEPIPATECPLYALLLEKTMKKVEGERIPINDEPDGLSS